VNNADDALPFHGFEIHAHQVVVRKVHDAVTGECGSGTKQERKENRDAKKFHRADDQLEAAR
jgi:hypothetical protein